MGPTLRIQNNSKTIPKIVLGSFVENGVEPKQYPKLFWGVWDTTVPIQNNYFMQVKSMFCVLERPNGFSRKFAYEPNTIPKQYQKLFWGKMGRTLMFQNNSKTIQKYVSVFNREDQCHARSLDCCCTHCKKNDTMQMNETNVFTPTLLHS